MAKPLHHATLLQQGFRLAGSTPTSLGTTHNYVMYKSHGNDVRPLAHHVTVDEMANNPGKYNASYHVTRLGQPYQNGAFDTVRVHKDYLQKGSRDPIGSLLEHHNNVVRGLALAPAPEMRPVRNNELGGMVNSGLTSHNSVQKRADAFDDIIRGNGYTGTCANCGKAVRDMPESSFRDDKLYQLTPEDDAPDPSMHGDPVNLCGNCYVDADMHSMAHRMPKMFGWHYPGAKPGSCPECDAHLMDQADEDLQP